MFDQVARSRLSEADLANFPLYTNAPFDNDGNWVEPPKYVALSDEDAYWVTKLVATKDRVSRWPLDLNATGEILADRIPQHPAPMAWSFGLASAHQP